MIRFFTVALILLVSLSFHTAGEASDIPAMTPIPNAGQASEICEASCMAHDCGWSGEWSKGEAGGPDMCDCGKVRERHIPGGVIRTKEQAEQACTEICTLNEMPWSGKISRIAGGFEMCACTYVSEWCEAKTN